MPLLRHGADKHESIVYSHLDPEKPAKQKPYKINFYAYYDFQQASKITPSAIFHNHPKILTCFIPIRIHDEFRGFVIPFNQ